MAGFNFYDGFEQPITDCPKHEEYAIKETGLDIPEQNHIPLDNTNVEIAGLIKKYAEAYQVDQDMVTTTFFTVASSAIGNRIRVKDLEFESNLSLWICHCAPSGYGKSPVVKSILKPITDKAAAYFAEYREKMKEWKQVKDGDKPRLRQAYLSDTTPEAMYESLQQNPNGLLLYRDELAGWIGDFGRYSNSSSEIQQLLSIHSGCDVPIGRKTTEHLYLHEPFLCVLGGIQPEVMAKTLGKAQFVENGFLARLLCVYPDVQIPLEYRYCTIPDSYKQTWANIVDRLSNIQPCTLTLSPEAKKLQMEYWGVVQRKIVEGDLFMQKIYAKFHNLVERWAGLTFVLSETNFSRGLTGTVIDVQSMSMAINAMDLFEKWAIKVRDKIYNSAPEARLTKAQVIQRFNEFYPIKNIQQFAESLGVSRPLVSRALNQGKEKE